MSFSSVRDVKEFSVKSSNFFFLSLTKVRDVPPSLIKTSMFSTSDSFKLIATCSVEVISDLVSILYSTYSILSMFEVVSSKISSGTKSSNA